MGSFAEFFILSFNVEVATPASISIFEELRTNLEMVWLIKFIWLVISPVEDSLWLTFKIKAKMPSIIPPATANIET